PFPTRRPSDLPTVASRPGGTASASACAPNAPAATASAAESAPATTNRRAVSSSGTGLSSGLPFAPGLHREGPDLIVQLQRVVARSQRLGEGVVEPVGADDLRADGPLRPPHLEGDGDQVTDALLLDVVQRPAAARQRAP